MKGFEEIYQKNVEAIFRFILRSVGRRDVAEDITGDVFVTLFENLDRMDRDQVVSWLYTVAKNRSVDYWRRKNLEERHAQSLETAAAVGQPEMGELLFENKSLKPIHRVCLTLRYVHGMDRSEISRETGLSDNQVKSCLQYARHLLRQQLKEPI